MKLAKEIEWVANDIKNQTEIICNIDQNPNHAAHLGRVTPCLLASITNMWGMVRNRPMTHGELLTAQQVPVYPETALWAGFPHVPLSMEGCSPASLRRMAGNSFNQTCSVAFIAWILSSVKPER